MMKQLPFSQSDIESLIKKYPTPFYIYDEASIRYQVQKLNEAFACDKGFKEYYALKALPNPQILKIIKEEGSGVDASALPKLFLCERGGVTCEEIMYTSNGA